LKLKICSSKNVQKTYVSLFIYLKHNLNNLYLYKV